MTSRPVNPGKRSINPRRARQITAQNLAEMPAIHRYTISDCIAAIIHQPFVIVRIFLPCFGVGCFTGVLWRVGSQSGGHCGGGQIGGHPGGGGVPATCVGGTERPPEGAGSSPKSGAFTLGRYSGAEFLVVTARDADVKPT